jgi:hypothetical protein
MIQFDFIALIVYSIGLLLWFLVWHFLVGYSLLKKMKLLNITFLGAVFVFIANIVLSFFSPIHEYAMDLKLLSYTEASAKTVAGLSLAIALFVVLGIKNQKIVESNPSTKLFLWLIFWSFLFSVIGTLPLYWMPPQKYWITALRHLKSVPYFFSIFTLGSAIIVFIYELGYKRKAIQEIEENKIFD